jgi:hypothetical protein
VCCKQRSNPCNDGEEEAEGEITLYLQNIYRVCVGGGESRRGEEGEERGGEGRSRE